MKRLIALLLTIAAPASAANLPSPNWPGPADRGEALLQRVSLDLHNRARAEFGVGRVAWNEELEAGALAHARYMAATNIYAHDRTPGRRKVAGENMWRGQRGLFSYEIMVGMMVEEKRFFRPGAFPNITSNGDWQSVAHYTQIVWPTTTEIGCAVASNATTDYFVCRYAPTGNKDGFVLARGGVPARDQMAPVGELAQRGN